MFNKNYVEFDEQFVFDTLEGIADDIVNGVVGVDNVDDTIVVVDDESVEFEKTGMPYDDSDDVDGEGYACVAYNYTAVNGRDELFEVQLFDYNNGDVVIQYEDYQIVLRSV
jgi:hypothetical protein